MEKKVEKILGKIASAEFGRHPNRPDLFGLQLHFSNELGTVNSDWVYLANIGLFSFSDGGNKRKNKTMEIIDHLNFLLMDAKVSHVSQLKDKPVEIKLVDGKIDGFRILTEVI